MLKSIRNNILNIKWLYNLETMAMQVVELCFGLISLILAQCTSIPQLIELKKTRNSSGISLWTYVIFNITSIFWVIWSFGFYFNQMFKGPGAGVELTKLFQWGLIPAVIMNVSNIFTMSYVLIMKISYMKQAKKLGVTELELSKILLAKDMKKYSNDGKINNFRRYLSLTIYLTLVVLGLTAMTVCLSIFGYVQSVEGTKDWVWVIVLNAIGAVTWEAVSWPQFIKSIREKDTTGVSLGWAIFLPVSCTVMVTYDALMSATTGDFSLGILFSLIFNGMISSYGVLILKLKNMYKAKKMGLTEVEYTKKVLLPLVKKRKQKRSK